jgi:hypothetical protein
MMPHPTRAMPSAALLGRLVRVYAGVPSGALPLGHGQGDNITLLWRGIDGEGPVKSRDLIRYAKYARRARTEHPKSCKSFNGVGEALPQGRALIAQDRRGVIPYPCVAPSVRYVTDAWCARTEHPKSGKSFNGVGWVLSRDRSLIAPDRLSWVCVFNAATCCRSFPRSRRRLHLTFSHHMEDTPSASLWPKWLVSRGHVAVPQMHPHMGRKFCAVVAQNLLPTTAGAS